MLQVSLAVVDIMVKLINLLIIEPPHEEDGDNVRKVSVEILEESYKELNSRKIKDSLSSFLPNMPGTVGYCCRYYGTPIHNVQGNLIKQIPLKRSLDTSWIRE